MAALITGLEKYVHRKKLRPNTDIIKVMRFKKEEWTEKKRTARWNIVKMENAKEFKYLGFIIQADGKHGTYITEGIKKAARVMK